MSFFRCEVKVIGRSTGQSAAAAHRYDSRVRRVNRADLQSVGAVNMPAWASSDSAKYWQAADQFERANGSLARRAILSFPVELPASGREQVVREWLSQNCPNMPAGWAVHDSGDGNPHVHVLVSERQNDGLDRSPELWFKRANSVSPAGGGAKKADLGSRRKEWLSTARASWATILNQNLPDDARVDHRSLKDRGISRQAQPKFGHKVLAIEGKGIRTRLVSSVIDDLASRCSIRCLSFIGKDGREVTFRAAREYEDRIDLVGRPSVAKCLEIAKMAQEKGWASVKVTGTPEFQLIMKAELRKAGVRIEGENHEQNRADHIESDERSSEPGSSHDGVGSDPGSPPNRDGDEQDRRPVGRPVVRDGGSGAHAERAAATPEAEAAGAAPGAPGFALADIGRRGSSHSGLKSDIRILAGQPQDGLPTEQKTGSVDMPQDLTLLQVRKQLRSLSLSASFEVGIRDSRSGRFQSIEMDRDGVLASVPRFKRENARGSDIYIRPSPKSTHPYFLLDDVSAKAIEQLKSDRLVPVLEVETSPMNFQVVVRAPEMLNQYSRKSVERLLRERYSSDLGSADGGHFMRLSGFTNRKPKHVQQDGRFPFCRLSSSRPDVVVPVAAWSEIRKSVSAATAAQSHFPALAGASAPQAQGGCDGFLPPGKLSRPSAKSLAVRMYESAKTRYGVALDSSRADFSVARALLQRGASEFVTERVLKETSPSLSDRKVGHDGDYISRTIAAAKSSIPESLRFEETGNDIADQASRSQHEHEAELAKKAEAARLSNPTNDHYRHPRLK